MTPRERILAALRGEPVDFVPLCAYPGLLPRGETERRLRNEGMGFFHRIGVVNAESRQVTTTTTTYWENGRWWVRNTVSTPVGEVTELLRTGGGYGTSLRCEFFIKRLEDYRVLEFMVKDTVYSPCPEAFHEAERTLGEDGAVIGNLGYSPLQQMLIMWMGPERFAIDYFEHPDEFFSLYELLCRRHEEQYDIAAESPAEFIEYGDNVTADMVGLERFQKYVVPCYNRLGERLHARGKRLGSHLDGNLRVLKEAIRDSRLDFIEAYNPPPDGDLSVREARECWGPKSIVINFTSSIHWRPQPEIEAHTRELLEHAAPGTGFIISVTENIPDPVWQESLTTILRVLRDYGPVPKGNAGSGRT